MYESQTELERELGEKVNSASDQVVHCARAYADYCSIE